MPTYDYHCEACNKSFTVQLTMKEHEARKPACPKCGSHQVKQMVSSVSVITSKKS
jgi:putative FmdB family regulatory protein